MKRILKIFISICIVAGIFNLCQLLIQKARVNDVEVSEDTNMGEVSLKKNTILIQKKNTILNFPFIFGERLYLYDIDKDREYLIADCVRPFHSFGDMLAVCNNTVYYNIFRDGPGIEVYSKGVNEVSKGKKILDQAGLYLVSSKDIYYLKIKETTYKEEQNFLYKKDLESGKTGIVLKENLSDVLRMDHGHIYSWNRFSKELLEIGEDTHSVTRYPTEESPLWIGYVDGHRFLSIDEGNVILYDKNTRKKHYLVKDIKKESELLTEKAKYENGYLYYNNQNLDFYRLDVYSGKNKKICSLSGIDKVKEYNKYKEYYADVNYCKDYITIDLSYAINHHLGIMKRRLLVFDYKGNLIKVQKLAAL